MAAAVTVQRAGGRYRRPLQKAGGGDVSVSGRYRKRPLQEAVIGSGRYRWPSQEAGGGDGSMPKHSGLERRELEGGTSRKPEDLKRPPGFTLYAKMAG
jgi:hypothetical protein